jgi:hypothetical protein
LVSYGLTGTLLQDVPPLDEPLQDVTIRNHVLTVAERLEDALGEEQWSFIDSCPAEWAALPIPNGPHHGGDSDGGDAVRDLPLYLPPQAEHLLDWFHVAMRLTVLQQTAKGLPQTTHDDEGTSEIREPVQRLLERLKWYLWHGHVYQALQVVQSAAMDLEVAVATSGDGTARKLLKAVEEFPTYLKNNAGFISNYGERYHHGERISTGFVGSTVNQVISKRMVKKQQMQSTKRGAHLLLQIRTRVLNDEWEATLRSWSPGFQSNPQRVAA